MFRNKPAALWAGVAAALSLAVSAAPAPAAMTFGWSAPVRLSAAGQSAWTPDVAYGGNGSAGLTRARHTRPGEGGPGGDRAPPRPPRPGRAPPPPPRPPPYGPPGGA